MPSPTLSQVLTQGGTLDSEFIRQIAIAGAFSEISNYKDAVRLHLFRSAPAPAKKKKQTGKTETSHVFVIYQTGRHGPQNGFRLVVVHRGYPIASATKDEGAAEDDIDVLEKEIPQGHMEVVILGEPGAVIEGDSDEEDGENA